MGKENLALPLGSFPSLRLTKHQVCPRRERHLLDLRQRLGASRGTEDACCAEGGEVGPVDWFYVSHVELSFDSS